MRVKILSCGLCMYECQQKKFLGGGVSNSSVEVKCLIKWISLLSHQNKKLMPMQCVLKVFNYSHYNVIGKV